MGKTPEKVYSSVGVLPFGMRYRRKVPVTENNNNNSSSNEHTDDDPAAMPAATVVKQQPKAKAKPPKAKRAVVTGASENRDTSNSNSEARANKDVEQAGDNQLEHRDVDPVDAVDDPSTVVVKSKSQQRHVDASKRLPEGASYTRKKKHKPVGNELPHKSDKKPTKNKSEKLGKEAPIAGESEAGPTTTVSSENAQEAMSTLSVEAVKTVESSEKQVTIADKDAVELPTTPKAKRQNKPKHRRQVHDRELTGSDRSSEKSDSVATESVHPVAAVSNLATKIKQPTESIDSPKTDVSESQPLQQTHVRKQRKDAAFELRRRKQTANYSNRKANPSLMKQLLWKVKPVATVAPAQTTPALTIVNEQTEASQNINEEDEELAYTREERHSLKAHANSATKTKKSLSCLVVESSSQETQSGSDDEAFGLQYSLISSDNAIASRYALASSSELDLTDVNFPTSLPLDKIESLASSDAKPKVHEVLLEDFVFKPAELFIQKRDIVVWRVSESTLGMVEHSLDATQFDRSETLVRKVSTPLLGAGSGFAWRFNVAGCIAIHCSVYNINGVIHVSEAAESVMKEQEKANAPARMTASQRRKKKMAAKAKKMAKVAEKASDNAELDTHSDHSEDVVVFHPSKDLTRVPEMDAGVCRAVLSQLEEVQAAAAAAFIVVGDIACPLVAELTEEDTTAVEVSPVGVDTLTDGDNDEVSDFQQRIIAMLQKSEAEQARHRSNFVLSHSGFDAGAAYDFFKRRFAQAQYASEAAVYARCPERQSSRGLMLSDLLSTLVEMEGTK